MIAICPLLYVTWKLVHKTKIHKAHEIDLHKNMDEIDAYERSYVPSKPGYASLFSLPRPPFEDSC